MRMLAIDIGTGTQDILLLDTARPVENAVKLVLPSPTEIAARRIRRVTVGRRPLVLTGTVQGGGPCHWAVGDHLGAGLRAYATPGAAQTFDDDPAMIERMGITVVSEDEAARVEGDTVVLRDLDLETLRRTFADYEVDPYFEGLAIGCLDHGAAPPGYSDRLFRFEHLRRVVQGRNSLLEFAFLPHELPAYLTRARAMIDSAGAAVPTVFMDTGPAAALGALQDTQLPASDEHLAMNLGNMHLLAFHLRGTHIHSLYEHHTGEVSAAEIVTMTEGLLDGALTQEAVFGSKGHGVTYVDEPSNRRPPVVVTGPQRGKLRGTRMRRYEAAPHGDMMIAGCFGLIAGFGEKYPEHREEIARALGVDWWR